MRSLYLAISLVALCAMLGACPNASRHGRKSPPPMAVDRSADSLADLRVCSPDGWCWENPMPQGNDLLAVWARSELRLLVVGRTGTVLSFNGHAWQREVLRGAGDLRAAHGALVQGRELMAVVGEEGRIYARQAKTERTKIEGKAESRASTPASWKRLATPSKATLFAVNVDPSGRVVAVGAGGLALGCSATKGCEKLLGAGTNSLHALTAAKDALWAVGDAGTVRRLPRGEKRFAQLASVTTKALHSAVIFKGALWAGGEGGVLVRCVAGGCEARTPLARKGKIIGLVGRGERLLALVDDGISAHLRLLGAAPAKETHISRRLFAFAPTGDKGLVAVGEGGSALLLSKKGWAHAMPLGSMARLAIIGGRSAEDAFAAGDGGTVMHFDGRSWQPLATGVEVPLRALCSDGEAHALVGGDKGLLLSCGASGCERSTLPRAIDIRALACEGGRVLAAGRAGLLLERRGDRWRGVDLGDAARGKDLLALWKGKGGSYLAGAGGLLMRRGKRGWLPMASNTKTAITSLWGDSTSLYAAAGKALLRCSAKGCAQLTTLAEGPIARIWGLGEGEAAMLFVSSQSGALHRYHQGRWSRERVGFDGRLRALWGWHGHLWAVGEKGAVLHRLPAPGSAEKR